MAYIYVNINKNHGFCSKNNKMKHLRYYIVLLMLLCNIGHVQAQTAYSAKFFSIIGGQIEQNDVTYNSGLGWGLGLAENIIGDEFGFTTEGDFRLIDVSNINWFDNEYKFLFDFYIGPSMFLFNDQHYSFAIMINALFGYSISCSLDDFISSLEWGKFGSLSFKLSADIVIEEFHFGVFYHPKKQRVKAGNGTEFTILPAWGIEIGIGPF